MQLREDPQDSHQGVPEVNIAVRSCQQAIFQFQLVVVASTGLLILCSVTREYDHRRPYQIVTFSHAPAIVRSRAPRSRAVRVLPAFSKLSIRGDELTFWAKTTHHH